MPWWYWTFAIYGTNAMYFIKSIVFWYLLSLLEKKFKKINTSSCISFPFVLKYKSATFCGVLECVGEGAAPSIKPLHKTTIYRRCVLWAKKLQRFVNFSSLQEELDRDQHWHLPESTCRSSVQHLTMLQRTVMVIWYQLLLLHTKTRALISY